MSRPRVAGLLVALVVARAMLSLVLWRPGWSALSEDDFFRVAIAQTWARDPFVLQSPSMVWLPLQAWIHGLAFRLSGHLFADSPMLLVALVNSLAGLGTAAIAARTAFVLSRSALGALVTFAVVLFAPYSVLASLSGLAEPLYYLAVAIGVWGLTEWLDRDRIWALTVGSLGVSAAAGIRYDGWLLAASWAVIIPFSLARKDDPSLPGLLRVWWRRRLEVALAVAPLIVPALRVGVYAAHYGTLTGFVALQSEGFAAQFGGQPFASELGRWSYYAIPLLRSAPVLVPVLLVLAAWCTWRMPLARPLVALLGLQFLVFSVLSVSSGAMGGYRERYMFTYAVGLSPLLGVLPSWIGRLRRRAAQVAVGAALAAFAIVATAHGIAARPDEWVPPADTLQLSSVLGQAARGRSGPLRVVLGPAFDMEGTILAVTNGRRLEVSRTTAPGVDTTGRIAAGVDVWVERMPARIAAIPIAAARVIGRYHLYGPGAANIPVPANALAGWARRDEQGAVTPLPPTRPLGLEFTRNDPRPGETVALERTLSRAAAPRHGALVIRSMYGHGFYAGRMTVDVRLDDRTIFTRDLAERSRWERVPFTIPAGNGDSKLALVLTASAAIEPGWEWGRASTTFIDRLDLD